MSTATQVLDHKQVMQRIERISWQIFEEFSAEKKVIIAGIADRGYLLAKEIYHRLKAITDMEVVLVELRFNKDEALNSDYLLEPNISLDDANIVLVDDVLKSGETLIYGVRHFLNYTIRSMKTVVLVDRNHKRYPVKADFKGLSLSTSMQEHVSVQISEAPYSVIVS